MAEFTLTEGAILITTPSSFHHRADWVIAPQPPPVVEQWDAQECPCCRRAIKRDSQWAVIPMLHLRDVWPRYACSRECALSMARAYSDLDLEQQVEESKLKREHSEQLRQLGERHRGVMRKMMQGIHKEIRRE